MPIEAQISLLEETLGAWKARIGQDYEGYKNHVYRMIHFCLALRPCNPEEREKIILAGAFHDIGLWSAHTVDYIPPSVLEARSYLKEKQLEKWSAEIELMISEHHKIREYQNPAFPLVELFRRGDLVDFSFGVVTFGLPKAYIQAVKAQFPNAGFHQNLLRLASKWFLKHPFNPAPMMKW